MAGRYRSVKGTRDLVWPETALWQHVEETARRVFATHGYGEIRTPLLESTELFARSVGEETDIVGKEMYTFPDRKGRSLTLRPESTAAVARAFIEQGLESRGLPSRLFYIGPHFRYERPQRGRYRQFSQIGAELVGAAGPASDVEIVLLLVRFLEALGFDDLTVLLNTVGDAASRAAYCDALVAFLSPRAEGLSADSRRRLEANPLRILDSKDPGDRSLLEGAPAMTDSLSAQARAHFAAVCDGIEACGVSYRLEPRLVRGLDYYALTVFEIVSRGLGAQDAIVGGGRYDGLLAQLGGPDLPAIGFAIGEDRLVEATAGRRAWRQPSIWPPAHAVAIDVAPVEALRLADELRRRGVAATSELDVRSLKAALKGAAREGRRWVLLVGPEELASGTVTIKHMESGEQETVARSEAVERLARESERP
jgi:histidyl-tRNA synthetase